MTEELKTCPFCDDIWLYVSDGDYYSGYEAYGYRVGCKCGFAWNTIDWCKTEEQAINSWNRRVSDEKTDNANYFDGDESDSLVAALEGKLREAEAAKIRAELEAKMAKEDAERMQKEIKTSAPDVAEFKVLLLIAAEVVAVLVLIAWLLGR